GFGAPGTDLVAIGMHMHQQNPKLKDVVFVFPAAPIQMDPLFDARAWWMIDIEKIQQMMMQGETRELAKESPELLPKRRNELSGLIDLCRVDFKLAPNQIVIGGFSQGAMLTTDVAIHYSEPLGGLIIWSGALINETIWLERIQNQHPLKIVQSHGRLDPILPMAGAEALRDRLVRHSHDVRFCEFQGQHAIPMEATDLAIQLIEETIE
ncbi:MAG: phospholipase, partial [Planctomycetota bacterium]